MEYTKGECKCRADNTTGEIVYCPLHKAAPDMYEALEKLVDLSRPLLREDMAEGNKALAKAEGKGE